MFFELFLSYLVPNATPPWSLLTIHCSFFPTLLRQLPPSKLYSSCSSFEGLTFTLGGVVRPWDASAELGWVEDSRVVGFLNLVGSLQSAPACTHLQVLLSHYFL